MPLKVSLMTKRFAAYGWCLVAALLVNGCQHNSAPARFSGNEKPLTTSELNPDEPLTNVSLPMPGSDGGPDLEGLPGGLDRPQVPELPPAPDLPPVPDLPQVPVVGSELELPPVPDASNANEGRPTVEQPSQQPAQESQ
jgi:hypothetical protein